MLIFEDNEIHLTNSSNSSQSDHSSDIKAKENTLIKSISSALSTILHKNLLSPHYTEEIKETQKMVLSISYKPTISLYEYISRIQSMTNLEQSTLIASMVYVDRIAHKGVFLNEYNIHRIVFMSCMASIKINEDLCYSNSYYATVCGVSLREFNRMEHEFYNILEFKLYIHNGLYEKYYQHFIDNKDNTNSIIKE